MKLQIVQRKDKLILAMALAAEDREYRERRQLVAAATCHSLAEVEALQAGGWPPSPAPSAAWP